MFYVYILRNDTNRDVYIGFTHNLRKRLLEHNKGKNTSTKRRRWHCIYYEACIEEEDARRRERYLKTTQGKRALRSRLNKYYSKVRRAN